MALLKRLGICLLNVSEARNHQIIENIAKAATKKTGNDSGIVSSVLNIFQDIDYNRSVFTIAAPIAHLETAVCNACEEAFRWIDLSSQQGVHPRLGSVDLIPIYPLTASVTLDECGAIARSIASHLNDAVPGTSFFLFGNADVPENRDLVARRRGIGWFTDRRSIDWSKFGHDLGAPPSNRYGLTGVGASHYVTNCNVTINTKDLAAGRDIAKAIRARTPGGLPGIQAMAFPHEGNIEIACNVDSIQSPHQNGTSNGDKTNRSEELQDDTPIILDYTTPEAIEQRVAELAAERQIKLVGTALVGFKPEQACKLAMEALETGQDQFWKTRHERMM